MKKCHIQIFFISLTKIVKWICYSNKKSCNTFKEIYGWAVIYRQTLSKMWTNLFVSVIMFAPFKLWFIDGILFLFALKGYLMRLIDNGIFFQIPLIFFWMLKETHSLYQSMPYSQTHIGTHKDRLKNSHKHNNVSVNNCRNYYVTSLGFFSKPQGQKKIIILFNILVDYWNAFVGWKINIKKLLINK